MQFVRIIFLWQVRCRGTSLGSSCVLIGTEQIKNSHSNSSITLSEKQAIMISTKKLIRMARKWRKITAIGRKRITSPRTNGKMVAADGSNKASVAYKGHFVVYTMDKKCLVIPLAYLSNSIFRELFKMSEEFGLSSDGPITLPCDSVTMSYIVLLVQRGLAKDLEKAVLNSMTGHRCSSYTTFFHEGHADQQSLVCGFWQQLIAVTMFNITNSDRD
ncbi:Small auxin-up RNA - like 10 [Theobroma cacao]|nr:Small auxin-up RNA - like 10 [Theobroma cacao]